MQAQEFNLSQSIHQQEKKWQIVNDVVMGGVSSSQYEFTSEGIRFSGEVRLENNGGFCMIQFTPGEIQVSDYTEIIIKVKAEPSTFQLRLKSSRKDDFNYYQPFKTTGEWQELRFELSNFEPQFRGRQLNKSNFKASTIEEISILIGNKKREQFEIQIAEIYFD